MFAKPEQWEKELLKFRQEIGKMKEDLRTQPISYGSAGEDGYRLATQIDLSVNRFLRIMEKNIENEEAICG